MLDGGAESGPGLEAGGGPHPTEARHSAEVKALTELLGVLGITERDAGEIAEKLVHRFGSIIRICAVSKLSILAVCPELPSHVGGCLQALGACARDLGRLG